MFAIWGQSVAFQVLKLGTHEDTHESGADAGRLKGVLREAPDHQESRAAFCPCCWNARGIHRLLCENVKPLSLPAPATGVDRPGGKGELLSIPHTSIRLPAPTRPRNSAEKRNRCCPVFDSLDMRRRCDRSKIGETGWWWGKGSACLVCREGAGGRSPSYQRKWQLDQCTVDQCCHQCSATDRCHHATSSSCSADPQQQQWLPQFRFWFQGSLLRDLCFG